MKLRNAFSLAEILVVVAILSVIAIFGFKIAGDGIDRAYNDYIYTGYEGLNIAIKAAEEAGENIAGNSKRFNTHIANIFNGTYNDGTESITAPNGISYTYNEPMPQNPNIYYFQMLTPKRRTNNGSSLNSTCLAYYPDENYNLLLPVGSIGNCATDLDIQQRPDLLLFYFDDGIAGRSIPNDSGVIEYHPIKYYTVLDAVCSKYGSGISGYTCTGITPDPDLEKALLKYAHPKRIATQ